MGEAGDQGGEPPAGICIPTSRFEYSQAIYTTNLPAAKEALTTEKERKLALDLIPRR